MKYSFILLLFLSSCSSLYHEHFFREHPVEPDSEVTMVGSSFFAASGTLIDLPDSEGLQNLIHSLRSAKIRIWIEIYTWTEIEDLTRAILDAKNRGVDVRVILEPSVYGTPMINRSMANKLTDAGIPVVYSDSARYTFTHAKFWIIDDRYTISTGNWTKSFFSKNREYVYSGMDIGTLDFLVSLFLSDFQHLSFKFTSQIPPQMVISPLNAREQVEKLIISAQKSIVFYIQSIDDPHIFELLSQLRYRTIKLSICTADNETNRNMMIKFPNISWKLVKNPYLHAKIIVVDNHTIFLGSQNLTTNALENNREVGIILEDVPEFVGKIQGDYEKDCK